MTVTDRVGGNPPRGRVTRPALGAGVRERGHPHRRQRLQRLAETWRQTTDTARRHYEGRPGLTVLTAQDFGAQPGDLNPLGYRDSIGQPAIEGSGIEPLPGQGPAIKAGEFILGYPGEAGVPLPAPQPDVLGRHGTYVGLRRYQSRVGAFNRFLRANAETDDEREMLAAKLVGRWRSGAPLTLAPDRDDPALGADPLRNNDFTYAADPHGRQVPRGSHMRRMNPRDTEMALLAEMNIHRIIRRSTTFGAPYDQNAFPPQDDETPQGLYFIFFSAKAMATMEFLRRRSSDPPLPPHAPQRGHHRRPAHPARAGHRIHPRRRPQPRMGANPSPGPVSTATTRRSASTGRPTCTTWASTPPHRQHLVDQSCASV